MVYVEILAVILLTLINGLLAMSELAIVSSRKSLLKQLASDGSRGAAAAVRLAEDPSRFLSTVQIGITLVGIIAGAFSGATLGQRLGSWLDTFPLFSHHGFAIGISVTVIAITYLSLVLGELVPKRIALSRPERIASLVAGPMKLLSVVAAPAVWLLHVSTESVLGVLGLSGKRESTVTEDEVKSLIAEGTQAGVFVPQVQEMIEGVLRLADRPVRVIMTPRSLVVWIEVNADEDSILNVIESNHFSRLLVCDGSVDHPLGTVHTKDLLPEAFRGSKGNLMDLMTPILFVPESTPVLRLLNMFKKEKVHIAVVVNEYGATEGLVTITDVLESIAGDFPELDEDFEPGIVQREDGSWLVDGMLPMDIIEKMTGIESEEEVNTVAGFVLQNLGRIPQPGEGFDYDNVHFEVVDMDGRRIDKVLIHIKTPAADGGDSGPVD
ncbi:MAG: hemolysin family protein [Candidatus Dadabacteria bacterium]